jgi:dTDP-4-dehydrorhamnose 3,5-epimerase
MNFRPLAIPGLAMVAIEPTYDERGFFARSFCADEFRAAGLLSEVVQCSISFNTRRLTLRGLHYQVEPFSDPKLVRCTRGRMFDAVVDLRPESPTYCGWAGVELAAVDHWTLHVPRGCAHGFLTLEDATEVFYMMSERQVPDAARGVRWNDPRFGIAWPAMPDVISERDAGYPDFPP